MNIEHLLTTFLFIVAITVSFMGFRLFRLQYKRTMENECLSKKDRFLVLFIDGLYCLVFSNSLLIMMILMQTGIVSNG